MNHPFPAQALLGEFGAEVDREDDEGYAPAHVCAAWGKTSALEWLLTRGAVHVERLHGNGMTLSMFAAVNGHLETLKCLRRLGADVRRPCFVDHDLIAGQRVQCTIMAMACYEGRDHVVKWLVDDCDVGKCESEIVVVDPAYIDEVTAREREAERRAKEELTAQRGAGKACDIPNFTGSDLGRCPLVSADVWTSDHLSERSRSVDVFFRNARARNTHVEATLHHPFPAQAQRARDAKKKNPYGRPYGPYGKPARRPSPPAEPPAAVDMSVVPDAAHPEAELLDAFAPAAATDNVDITVDDAADTPPHD